jgi:hypothetical protein
VAFGPRAPLIGQNLQRLRAAALLEHRPAVLDLGQEEPKSAGCRAQKCDLL